MQLIILGAIYLVIGLINDFVYSTLAHYLGRLLGKKVSKFVILFGGIFLIFSGIVVIK